MELTNLKAKNQQLFAENEAISAENMHLRKKLMNEHRDSVIKPPSHCGNIEVISSNGTSNGMNVTRAERNQFGGDDGGTRIVRSVATAASSKTTCELVKHSTENRATQLRTNRSTEATLIVNGSQSVEPAAMPSKCDEQETSMAAMKLAKPIVTSKPQKSMAASPKPSTSSQTTQLPDLSIPKKDTQQNNARPSGSLVFRDRTSFAAKSSKETVTKPAKIGLKAKVGAATTKTSISKIPANLASSTKSSNDFGPPNKKSKKPNCAGNGCVSGKTSSDTLSEGHQVSTKRKDFNHNDAFSTVPLNQKASSKHQSIRTSGDSKRKSTAVNVPNASKKRMQLAYDETNAVEKSNKNDTTASQSSLITKRRKTHA